MAWLALRRAGLKRTSSSLREQGSRLSAQGCLRPVCAFAGEPRGTWCDTLVGTFGACACFGAVCGAGDLLCKSETCPEACMVGRRS
jgi:hypothetical protein